MSILLYGCTTWTLIKRTEKKLDANYTRMLRAILNKSWRQHPIKLHLRSITKTTQVRRTRHVGHGWKSKYEHLSDILLCTTSHGLAKIGRPDRTYIQHLCADTGWRLEDLPGAMDDTDRWWERVREIRAGGATWWSWWWWCSRAERHIWSSTWCLQ